MKIAIRREFWYAALLLVSCMAVAFYFFTTSTTKVADAAAGPPFALKGYAWASTDYWDGISAPPPVETGAGWISMNCIDGGPNKTNVCGSSDYHVQIDTVPTKSTPANLSGYAWAGGNTSGGVPSAFGWVSFNDNGCPAADSDGSNCHPHVIVNPDTGGSGWELMGWARACTVFANGCSGTLKSTTELGGWDGWISLNCLNTNSCGTADYAVRINSSGKFNTSTDDTGSFAWGDMVVGWMNFSLVDILDLNVPLPPPTYACSPLPAENSEETTKDIWGNSETVVTDCTTTSKVCDRVITSPTAGRCIPVVPPTVTLNSFTITPPIVRKGGTVNVSWDVTGATTCNVTVSDGNPDLTGGAVATNVSSAPITQSQTTFTLSCDSVELASSTVKTLPTIYE